MSSRFLTHRPLRVSLSWLVWLALLLPVAQSTAHWHAFSHLAADAQAGEHRPHAPHPDRCDLCLAAAAIGGGVLPSAALALALPAAVEVAPRGVAAVGRLPAPLALAYRSRAPPTAAC